MVTLFNNDDPPISVFLFILMVSFQFLVPKLLIRHCPGVGEIGKYVIDDDVGQVRHLF